MEAAFTKRALKNLRRLDRVTQKQILKKLDFYLGSPQPLKYAEKLTDFKKDGQYRFRIGSYRVIFDVNGDINILRIQHRKEIYRK